jgi:cation:H+ antiporter
MLIVSLLAGCVFYDGVLSYSDGIFAGAGRLWLLLVLKSPVWLKAREAIA